MLFSLTSEQGILGSLLINNDSIDKIPNLQAEHFYNHDHREIFLEIVRQIKAGKQADLITVASELKIADGMVYLNQLIQSTPTSNLIKRYSDEVVNLGIKRALVAISNEASELVRENKESSVCVDLMASKLELLTRNSIEKEPKKLKDTLIDYYSVIEKRMTGKIKPIATGFDYLDKRLGGGLERGTLCVVAGRPAMGKSAFGVALSMNVAREQTSLYVSMEMSETQLNDRIIAVLGEIPINFLRNPEDSDENKPHWDKLTAATARANELNLHIDEQTALNMMQIRNKARKVKRKFGLDCLVIDQLSFITGAESVNSWDRAGEYTRGLIQLAKELDIVVVLLCQLNRECEKRQNKRPMLSDLASSGSIEQDAATILFLYRDVVYNQETQEKDLAEIIIGKQRQGPTGTCYLKFIDDRTEFKSLSLDYQPTRQPEIRTEKRKAWHDDM